MIGKIIGTFAAGVLFKILIRIAITILVITLIVKLIKKLLGGKNKGNQVQMNTSNGNSNQDMMKWD